MYQGSMMTFQIESIRQRIVLNQQVIHQGQRQQDDHDP